MATTRTIEEKAHDLWVWQNTLPRIRDSVMAFICAKQADAHRSDPHTWSRTFAHLWNNVLCPEDMGYVYDKYGDCRLLLS